MAKEKWFQNPMIWIIIIVLAAVVWVVWPSGASEYDTFASCLSESGAVMYGTEWCSHCKDQKEMFGDSFDNINFIDCDRDRDACLIAGVQGYPTWVIGGESYPGQQPLQELADLTGCELAKDTE
jgi:hypothetical protein